ncbi:MAG: hypothetical protein J5906_01100 [Acidaminococcaceae bacterium]|nr:hypothetical protein [Acidaminococcaceae bacterium]
MRCFYHDVDAAASCNRCGKGLCRDCTITMDNGEVICRDCFQGIINGQKSMAAQVDRRFNIGKVLGVIAFVFALFKLDASIIGALIIALWVASWPISIFFSNKTDDPYVATSWESAGNLILGKLFIAIIGSPFIAIPAINGQKKRKSIIAKNEALLNSLVNR